MRRKSTTEAELITYQLQPPDCGVTPYCVTSNVELVAKLTIANVPTTAAEWMMYQV